MESELLNSSPIRYAAPHRVFVLEDDLELINVIECVLRSIDSAVNLEWSTSAEEAVIQLKSAVNSGQYSPYDLIVADIFLDGESTGIDFWRACQVFVPRIPVVITSALSLDRFFSIVGKQAISPPYLQKPFTPIECKQMFQGMLSYASPERKSEKYRRKLWYY